MKHQFSALVLIFFFSCATTESGNKLEEIFDQIHLDTGYSGAILVVQEEEILLSKAYGSSGLMEPVPLAMDTPFRTGMVTKSFTIQNTGK